jgi:hypothetical protein
MSTESDLQDLKKDVGTLRADSQGALNAIGGVIGVVANIAGVVGIPATIVGLIPAITQLFSGPDRATEEALNRIEGLLAVTFKFDVAEADFIQMKDVSNLATDCRSALDSLLSQPYSPETSALAEANSRAAIDKLQQEIYWQRVFFDQLVYSDRWFGRVMPPADDFSSPRAGSKLVFNYRLTLPCYLKALSARIATVLLLVNSGAMVQQAAITEMRSRASTLEDYYKRILKGFVFAPVPTLEQIIYTLVPPDWAALHNFAPSAFDQSDLFVDRPIGVVQAHDGGGIVGVDENYPVELFPNISLGPFSPPLVVSISPAASFPDSRQGIDLE